jgi:hypothetical protein
MHEVAYLLSYASIGCISLAVYAYFAYYVTRNGDFYKVRRWKAAIWTALLSIVILLSLFAFVGILGIISTIIENPTISFGTIIKDFFQMLKLASFELIVLSPCLAHILFVITIGTYYRLKGWLQSDDYLDKIWKDPNRGKRSPLQWL